jgi:hypothetical protein
MLSSGKLYSKKCAAFVEVKLQIDAAESQKSAGLIYIAAEN